MFVAFQDTGPGIPAAQLDRVFEPFFTTKAKSGGTGLGLSITRRIVQSYGGDVSVANSSGSGARLMLKIPVAHGAAEGT